VYHCRVESASQYFFAILLLLLLLVIVIMVMVAGVSHLKAGAMSLSLGALIFTQCCSSYIPVPS